MKKVISATLGIVFTVVQALLPLGDIGKSLEYRLFIAACFSALWILYTVYSEKIDTIILRSGLGRYSQKRNAIETVTYFHSTITHTAHTLQNTVIKESDSAFVQNLYYHNWCEVIDFVSMDCCNTGEYINSSVVSTSRYRHAKRFLNRTIDLRYLSNVVEALYTCDKNNKTYFSREIDYMVYFGRLESINKLVRQEMKKY